MPLTLRNGLKSLVKASAPTTPAAGDRVAYPKSDGWHDLDSSGVDGLMPRVDTSGHLPITVLRQNARQMEAFRRTNALAETMPRTNSLANCPALTASKITLTGIYLLKDTVVTNVTFMTGGTAGATLTHIWYSLWDSSLNQLKLTADDTSASWATYTEKTLALATTYTVTADALFYLGVTVTGTTQPALLGMSMNAAITTLAPAIGNVSNTTYTTGPASAPNPIASTVNYGGQLWAWIS